MTAAAVVEPAAYAHPRIRRSIPAIVIVAVLAVALAFCVPTVTTILRGETDYTSLFRSFPGTTTGVLSTVFRAIADLAAWVTIGCLVVVMGIAAVPGRGRLAVVDEPEWRLLRCSLLTWMVSAAVLVPVDAGDANGLSVSRLTEPGALGYLVDAASLPKAWIFVFCATALAFLVSVFAHRWAAFLVIAWLGALSILAPVVIGQVQVGLNHDFGSDAAIFQSLAAAVLFGTAIVLGLRVATGRLLRPAAVVRAGWVLAVSWVVVAAADVVLALFKLAGPSATNPTVYFLLSRSAVILLTGIVLASFWLRRRRWSDRRLVWTLALLVLCAGGYAGLTGAMNRIPPPQYFVDSNISVVYFGYDLTDISPTLGVMLTHWRPNILFLVISLLAVGVYLAAVVRLHRRGDRWPLGRTVAWVLGWVVVVISTSSALGQYSGSQFGVHMIVHMSLNMLAPVLLVLGGVVTLLLRATTAHPRSQPAGPHEWLTAVLQWPGLRLIFNPFLVFIVYIGSYYALYLTPLFENIMRFHWAHQAMNVHFLIVGYLFYGLIVGVDRPPRPLPPIGKLGFVLAAMPFHAFFGIILMTASVPIAENFYLTLDFPWMGDLMAQQYLGGGIAWAGGELPLVLVVIALGVQWARQDQREAVRKDRHLDSGVDHEFDDYNRMLARLASRADRSPGPAPTGAGDSEKETP